MPRFFIGSNRGIYPKKGDVLLGKRHPLANCAACLYRVGFGYTTMSRMLRKNKGLCRKWVRRAGLGAGNKRKIKWRKSIHDQLRFNPERLILEEYKREQKAVGRPEILWSFLARAQANRNRASQQWYARKDDATWREARYEASRRWRQRTGNINSNLWKKKNPVAFRAWKRGYIKRNPELKLIMNMRARMRAFIKRGHRLARVSKVLGCTRQQFKSYIAARFAGGMSWENYGEWQLDHITPCAAFVQSCPVQFGYCWHHTNFQPLWAEDNHAKSDSM